MTNKKWLYKYKKWLYKWQIKNDYTNIKNDYTNEWQINNDYKNKKWLYNWENIWLENVLLSQVVIKVLTSWLQNICLVPNLQHLQTKLILTRWSKGVIYHLYPFPIIFSQTLLPDLHFYARLHLQENLVKIYFVSFSTYVAAQYCTAHSNGQRPH